jgi:hypothetical protein
VSLFSLSCGKNPTGIPQISGVVGPLFNLVDGKLMMTFKFLNLNLDAGIKAPIPETQNSSFELAPNIVDGGILAVFYLDVKDLESIDIGIGDGNYLPDGRPLPGVPGGRLEDSLRIDTEFKDISFYYHEKLFGVWIPFGFETAGISGYWNMWFNDLNMGMLGLVGNDPVNNYKAGGLVFLRLENLRKSSVRKMIELSRRNPHRVF